MINYIRRLFTPAPQPVSLNYNKIFRNSNMALKNKTNKTASYTTLSNNLVTALDTLALTLNDAGCSDDACASIFAAARQIRITAREAGIQSRFDRQVNQSDFAGVFNDYDYNYTKWSNGTVSPVRG